MAARAYHQSSSARSSQRSQVCGRRAYFAGSNMHCNVGLATLVKVAPISDRLDAGTHSVSIVGTPVSLIPRSNAERRSVVFDGGDRIVVKATANGFWMLPAPDYMGYA